jgi:hypothetical protein
MLLDYVHRRVPVIHGQDRGEFPDLVARNWRVDFGCMAGKHLEQLPSSEYARLSRRRRILTFLFLQTDTLINVARLCFGLNMFTTSPLEAFVCREVGLRTIRIIRILTLGKGHRDVVLPRQAIQLSSARGRHHRPNLFHNAWYASAHLY